MVYVYSFGDWLQKGGSAMNFSITIDWRFVVALGGITVGSIIVMKMDSTETERALIYAIDACKELVISKNDNY